MSDIPSLILQGIRDFAANRPRSLQKEIGPSGIGNPCDHCLTAALVGWEKMGDEAWLPLIGTAVHELLLNDYRDEFGSVTPSAFSGPDWLTEHRVEVGHIAGVAVTGNADLFYIPTETVVDLKIVGLSTLNEVRRHGASEQYRTQVQLYGRGFERQGAMVNEVTIAFLPRNSMRLSDAVFCSYPYNESIAVEALNRAEELLGRAREMEKISERVRDVYIDSLDRSPGCYDCARYPIIVPRASQLAAEYATTHQGD